jgi:hypothetical protein
MDDLLTYDEAVAMLPDGNSIHTFRGGGFMLLGADWSRESILKALQAAPEIRRAGDVATSMHHPIAINCDGWLFIEAKREAA